MSLNEFIQMGDHGFYVWSCYIATLIIFLGLFSAVRIQHKKILQQLRRRYKREAMQASIQQSNSGGIAQ